MKITIKDSIGNIRDYSGYYDRKQVPFQYQEQYDPGRGRTKTGAIAFFNIDASFVVPVEDQEIKVYRDTAGTDLVFGGLVSQVNPGVVSRTDTTWLNRYDLKLEGYDPYTLQFREVVDYEKISVRAGQVLVDLLTKYAPWISTTNVQVGSSPIIKKVHIERTVLSDVVQAILSATGWTFYVNDTADAYFNASASLALNWGLTEGTTPDYFPEFDFESLQPQSNVEDNTNDITIIGGLARSSPVVESFTFNGVTGSKGLAEIPFGLDSSVQIFDAFDSNGIDSGSWYENDTGNKITASSRRLQITSGVTTAAILVNKNLYSRDTNSEIRFAELQLTNIGGTSPDVLTLGVHNGTQSTTLSNFIHALEFNQAEAGDLYYREGASTTQLVGRPVGVGIYSIRISIKSGGGAIYYIQGGRTATPKEYGELGSRNWTKIVETSSDTTAFLGLAIYASGVKAGTVIRAKVQKQIDATVTLLSGGRLGSGAVVGADTVILCGIEKSLDYETDCFISVRDGDPQLEFFTDNLPLGTVRISYFKEDTIRERVIDNTNRATVDGRSALTGDDGTRSKTITGQDFVVDPQDARDLLKAYLAKTASIHYSGSFTTDTLRLSKLIPVGNKPIAGQQITLTLPNTWHISSSEVISAVRGQDIGGQIMQFSVDFGPGKTSFDQLLMRLHNQSAPEIIDSQDAIIATPTFIDYEDVSTVATARPATPLFSTGVFDGTGVSISWAAVSGATAYEVRDNLYVGQGQGGSLVYQNSAGTSYTISAASINASHKKRKFKFYIWSITSGKYCKYPLVITVENPAPVPQPIRDITNPNGLSITVRFAPEVETDVLASGRLIQIATDRAMSALVVSTGISKTVENYDFTTATANTTYYIRYGLSDDYTASLGDLLYSGIREIKAGAADFSGTVQYINNIAPDNAPSGLSQVTTAFSVGTGYHIQLTWSYTQGTNVATHFGIIIRRGGGTPTLTDDYFITEANKRTYTIDVPGGDILSFGLFAFAVTRGGVTRNTTITTLNNQVIGGTTGIFTAPGGGSIGIGTLSANSISIGSGSSTLDIVSASTFWRDLLPQGVSAVDIGSSGQPFDDIYANALRGGLIYRAGTELNSVYAGISHAHSASDITSGTLADARLSSNVPLKNGSNAMTNTNTHTGTVDISSGSLILKKFTQTSFPTLALSEIALWHDNTGGGGDPVYIVVNFEGSNLKVQIT